MCSMSVVRYITHAQVQIDPDVPVPEWSLSEVGRARSIAMLEQPWVPTIRRVVSSAETKAIEMATILADHLGLEVEIRPDTGETDRSATGYVTHERHEELADEFFAHPDRSAAGWETAEAVQHRMIRATADLLKDGDDVAIVGHGGAGTLLYCHLAAVGISRDLDQPGGGHYWAWDATTGEMHHHWRAVDDIEPDRDS